MLHRFRATPGQAANLLYRVYTLDRSTLVVSKQSTTPANPITEERPGSYAVDVGTIPGSHWYASATLVDTGELAADGYISAAQLDMGEPIYALFDKLASITAGQVNVVSPTNPDGTINPLVRGDDYKIANGRQLDFFFDPIAGVDVSTATCLFGAEKANKGSWLVSGAVSLVSGQWRCRFELASDDTIDCLPSCYPFTVTLITALRTSKVQGEVELRDSQTLP